MDEVVQERSEINRQASIVRYKDLSAWSVSTRKSIAWGWPKYLLRPLGAVVTRRREIALDTMTPETAVTLLTIRFDGSVVQRDRIKARHIRGKLFRVRPGDLVFSKIDIRNGAVGLAPPGLDRMCVTAEYPVYSVNRREVCPQFVALLLRTNTFLDLVKSITSGTTGRKRLHPEKFEEIDIAVPSVASQSRVVRYWSKAMSERKRAYDAVLAVTAELDEYLYDQTTALDRAIRSKVLLTNFSDIQQWDLKSGRAAAFIASNPGFFRLGDFTEERNETARPWSSPGKRWPVYGVNNKTGVFLSSHQLGRDFRTAYKRITKEDFVHNPTRASVGALGMVPDVPDDAITSPEYQVWRLRDGFVPSFMDLMLQTSYFLNLVSFNRVGGVKQRTYYANLVEIRVPQLPERVQREFANRRRSSLKTLSGADRTLARRRSDIERMIIGLRDDEEGWNGP